MRHVQLRGARQHAAPSLALRAASAHIGPALSPRPAPCGRVGYSKLALARLKDSHRVSAGQPDVGLGTGNFTTTKELELTRRALSDAIAKMALLKEQVSVTDSLQQQLGEQDAIISKLKGLIGAPEQQGYSDSQSGGELAQLRAKLLEVEARMHAVQKQEQAEIDRLNGLLASQEAGMQSLKRAVEATHGQRFEAEAAAQAAIKEAKDAASRLLQQQEEYLAIEGEVEKLRKAGSAAATKALNGPRGKGFGGKNVGAATKEQLAKSQEALSKLKATLSEKESALAASHAKLEALRAREVQQAVQLTNAERETEESRQKVAEREAAILAAREARSAEGGDEKLMAMILEETEAKEAAMEVEARLRSEVEGLSSECEQAADECERLRSLLASIEQRNSSQSAALASLDAELHALHGDVMDVNAMRDDMSAMRELLTAKEAELDQIRNQLRAALTRESEMNVELMGAHDGMVRLQTLLGDMNTANQNLVGSLGVLEAEKRQKERATRNAVSKVEEAEQLLSELGPRVMDLRAELSTREEALSEVRERLNDASSKEASQLTHIESLLTELEEQRQMMAQHEEVTGAELSAARALKSNQAARLERLTIELERLREEMQAVQGSAEDIFELKGDAIFKELGMQDGGDVAELRRMLVSVSRDNKDLFTTLDASIKQVEMLTTLDDARVAELQTAYESTTTMRVEIGRLQDELEQHLKAEQEDPELMQAEAEAAQKAAALVAERDAQLSEAVAEKEKAEAGALALREKAAALAQEVAEARRASAAAAAAAASASSPDISPQAASSIEGDVQKLYFQLKEEVEATNALLSKAEELVRTSAQAAVPLRPPPWQAISEEHEAALDEARNQLLASQADAEELRARVKQVEQSIADQDAELAEFLAASQRGGNPSLGALTEKIQALSVENSVLKSSAAAQDQHVAQAQGFLQAKLKSLVDRRAKASE